MFTPAAKSTFQRLFSWAKCCKKSNQYNEGRPLRNQEILVPEPEPPEPQPLNTIVDDTGIPEEEDR